jgi:FkbH-like protein
MVNTLPNIEHVATKKTSIKCVVWDLDNTIWDGVLLEDEQVTLRTRIVEVIQELDGRGILHSIASKNDYATAMEKLKQLGLAEYFLYPQINWNSKASSVLEIARLINIGIDTIAFVDDQSFERDEVAYGAPEVLCIDALDAEQMCKQAAFRPKFVTEDSRKRRQMYLSDITRNRDEKDFQGPSEDFLASLDMVFTIKEAVEDDLQRAEELAVRTHQLNTTGYTYSYDELNAFRTSDTHKLYVSGLDDKYGSYGKIGLALVICEPKVWTVKLLLMSCRVVSRGVGTIMINYIMQQAKAAGAVVQAEFVSNDRNRMMYITYKFNGFKAIETRGNYCLFENDATNIQPFPDYVTVHVDAN